MIKLVFFLTFLISNNEDLKIIREHFTLLNKSEASVLIIKNITEHSVTLPVSLKKAYSAIAEMASAQYEINPINKLASFNSGKILLENAIKLDPLNIELRYLRMCIQDNAPFFLGYNKNLKADTKYLISNLKSIKRSDLDLYSRIYSYLIIHCNLNSQEKKMLHE